MAQSKNLPANAETQIWSNLEKFHMPGATGPVYHNYWAPCLEIVLFNKEAACEEPRAAQAPPGHILRALQLE